MSRMRPLKSARFARSHSQWWCDDIIAGVCHQAALLIIHTLRLCSGCAEACFVQTVPRIETQARCKGRLLYSSLPDLYRRSDSSHTPHGIAANMLLVWPQGSPDDEFSSGDDLIIPCDVTFHGCIDVPQMTRFPLRANLKLGQWYGHQDRR